MNAQPFSSHSIRKITLIEVDIAWGKGVEGDPIRRVKYYHTESGDVVAVHDPEHPHEAVLFSQSQGM